MATSGSTKTTATSNSGGGGGSSGSVVPADTKSASASTADDKNKNNNEQERKKLKVDTNTANTSEDDDADNDNEELLESTLFRLTQGLPRRELQLIVSEADECEELLRKDIELLEKALADAGGGGGGGKEVAADDDERELLNETILDSLLTPLDRYWTASALVGRLNGPLALPPIPTLQAPAAAAAAAAAAGGGGTVSTAAANQKLSTRLDDARTRQLSKDLIDLQQHPRYTMQHETPQNLLALHKKVLIHRSSVVFKRPVKPEEAPGYTDRIFFPMDLSLVRKLIVSKQITTYQQFHRYIGLISHNCVLFNGRESDYGLVAREFERAADEAVRHAVSGVAPSRNKTPTPRPSSTTPAASASSAAATAPTETGTAALPSEKTAAPAAASKTATTTKKKN